MCLLRDHLLAAADSARDSAARTGCFPKRVIDCRHFQHENREDLAAISLVRTAADSSARDTKQYYGGAPPAHHYGVDDSEISGDCAVRRVDVNNPDSFPQIASAALSPERQLRPAVVRDFSP